MKILTAGTGTRPDDFARTVLGEPVYFSLVCDRDENGDRGCGCGRSFAGLGSGSPTTVAVVADVDYDVDTLASMLRDSLRSRGWDPDDEMAMDLALDVVDVAAEYDLGTRLRRNVDEVIPE